MTDLYLLGKGNCGKVNTDADFIVAIGKGLYDRNGGSNCDQVSSLLFIVTFNLSYLLVGRNRECRKRKEILRQDKRQLPGVQRQ